MGSQQVRLSGSGGQGLILAARILASALVGEGRNIAQSQSYEPVSRGGLSRSDLIISDGEAAFPLADTLDVLLILHGDASRASTGLLNAKSLVLTDSDLVTDPPKGRFKTVSLPFSETARLLGNKRVANIVALGAIAARSDICGAGALEAAIASNTPPKFSRLNVEAFAAGQNLCKAEVPA